MQKHVLVVDDDPLVVKIVRRALQREGISVATAANGAERLLAVASHLPDLIVLDITMPVMDGFQVLRVLRERPETSRLPVIVLTARVEDSDVVQALMTGADLYLAKPFEVQELLAAANRMLDIGARPDTAEQS